MTSPSTATAPRPVHTCELLDRSIVWQLRDEDRMARDFERSYAANTALAFRRRDAELAFCILISPEASHLATISVSDAQTTRKITATVYHLGDDGFDEDWSTTYTLGKPAAPDGESSSSWERDHMHGGVTEDGTSLMLLYKPKSGSTNAFTVTRDGFIPRLPPSDTADRYAISTGMVSDDGECIFYTRRGQKFGSGGQGEAVEIYSLRSMARLKAMTFSFGDGRTMRNTRLLQPLRLRGPIYIAVEASTFRGDELSVPPTDSMLLASSDRKLHSHVCGLDRFTGTNNPPNGSISPDGAHLVCVDMDEGVRHWDLRKPTLRPIGATTLPGVLYGASRRWRIFGKETTMRDAVPDQLHTIRYSPACKVVTIVTVGAGQVVINVLLTCNLQLVYHKTIPHPTWPGFKALHIGFNESTGLAVVAMSPTTSVNRSGVNMVVGVLGVVLPLRDEFDSIRKIEDYFDYGSIGTAGLESIHRADTIPECRFSWRPGAVERGDAAAIVYESGQAPIMSAVDARRQKDFYDKNFANPRSSVRMASDPETRQFIMPHLFSFRYPWAPDQTVSIFGIVMKYQYHIITIGPSPSAPGKSHDIVRALYANDTKTGLWEGSELIEIYMAGGTYILYVSQDKGSTAYSGAPMPRLRRTIASPHFLEEDAWYDTFIIHAARHATMPTGWTSTPNSALMATANIHAYFLPNSFVATDVIDYGHRASAAHAAPKYLLWVEYGLRGSRKARSADVLFGGGTYADSLGPCLRSVYDDRMYDDKAPLISSSLALSCNAAYRSRETSRVDAFFRRLHQEDQLVLNNSQSISNTLPLACRARPLAALSFMRHLVLFRFKINDIGIVEVRNNASAKVKTRRSFDSRWYQVREFILDIWLWIWPQWSDSNGVVEEPNTKYITLPLQSFCSFHTTLHRAPPRSSRDEDAFWEFIRATTPYDGDETSRWERQILAWVVHSGKGPASPFTRLVEEILEMKDREMQLSFLRVAWLEKLLAWKLKKFGLHVYLTRNILPIVLLFTMNLAVAVLLTESDDQKSRDRGTRIVTIVLASVEGLLSIYIMYTKGRQLFRVPRLFLSSIPNYIDFIALSLGIALFVTVTTGTPPREFLAFSTLLMWVAAILMLRIYRPVGMLLLLLTETIQEVFPFLALLIFIILGFAFVPYLLLRNHAVESEASNVFSSFPLTIAQMINFVASDYEALQPFEAGSAAVRTLKALYIVVITVMFLNTLIAILNLKIKRADKNAANLYHLQMASLQVQIELGLLSASERARHDWFPEWFSYSMTETEERTWKEYVESKPLKWTEENSFGEDADHAPPAPVDPDNESHPQQANHATVATETARPEASRTSTTTPTTLSNSMPRTTPTAAPAEQSTTAGQATGSTQQTTTASPANKVTKNTPLIFHNKKPAEDLLSKLKPFNVSQLPDPTDSTRDNKLAYDPGGESNQARGGGPSSISTDPPPPAKAQLTAVKMGAAVNNPPATASKPTTVAAESIELTGITDKCVICGQAGLKCQGCQTVAYCSKEHQRKDWKRHKSACKGKGRADNRL